MTFYSEDEKREKDIWSLIRSPYDRWSVTVIRFTPEGMVPESNQCEDDTLLQFSQLVQFAFTK